MLISLCLLSTATCYCYSLLLASREGNFPASTLGHGRRAVDTGSPNFKSSFVPPKRFSGERAPVGLRSSGHLLGCGRAPRGARCQVRLPLNAKRAKGLPPKGVVPLGSITFDCFRRLSCPHYHHYQNHFSCIMSTSARRRLLRDFKR